MEREHHKVSDREQRLAARRQRIAGKLALQAVAASQDQGDGNEGHEQGLEQALLTQSAASFLKRQISIQNGFAGLQTKCQQREHDRTRNDQVLHKELRTMSICISQSGQSLADHISTGWTEAADIHQAQDLFAALSQQHEACAKLLAFKDSLLAAMKAALTAKEGKYVQTLGMHGKELEDVLAEMHVQAQVLAQEQDAQVELLSSALSAKRSRTLEECQAGMDVQLDQLHASEQSALDTYLAATGQHQQRLNDAANKAADDHELLRQSQSEEVQQSTAGQQSLCRAHLWQEYDLAYADRTLREQTEERTLLLDRQKHRMAQFRDVLHCLKREYGGAETEHAQLSADLTRGYTCNLEVYASQQARMQAFKQAEATKRRKVLELKAQEVKDMLSNLVRLQILVAT